MEELSKYKLYRIKPFNSLGQIFIAITGTKEINNPMINTEWHYFVEIDGRNEKREINCIKYDTIDEFWECETLINLKQTIYNKIIVPCKNKIHSSEIKINSYDDIELIEWEDNLHYINIYHNKFLKYLKQNTKCNLLLNILQNIC